MPNETTQAPAKGLPGASARYRGACAAMAEKGRVVLLCCQRGHGTYAMCAQAAERTGAKNALLVVPRALEGSAMDQLEQFGYAAAQISGKKGCMAEACRQADASRDEKPAVFVAAPRQMAEAGHWVEAWRDRRPFDFVAVLEAERHANLRSEQNMGLRGVAERAGTALLVCCQDAASPAEIARLQAAWGAELRGVPCTAFPQDPGAAGTTGMDTGRPPVL